MWVGVLGPTVVGETQGQAGRTPRLSAARHRALLAALALHRDRAVSSGQLVEAVWGPGAPAGAAGTLQTYVSAVRRALEPDLPPRQPSRHLVSSDAGYRLTVPEEAVDAAVFDTAVRGVHTDLGEATTSVTPVLDPAIGERLRARLEEALDLWRGTPYLDVADTADLLAERGRLEELRLLAQEDLATVRLASGDAATATTELEVLTALQPLRERPWVLLAVALVRSGRQADALAALDRLRRMLDDELGLEPSLAVRELQTAILRQDAALAPPVPRATPTRPGRVGTGELAGAPWPLVGRDDQLGGLLDLWRAAQEGRRGFAELVGEPGAGKSRLAAELGARVSADGGLVLVGRCSQDEDAPTLWPWVSALGSRLAPWPSATGNHDADRFAVAEGISRSLDAVAVDQGVLLVLEDLHWADPFSLRVLRHVCTHGGEGRLLLVCTWRDAEGDGHLDEAAEALARRHATRIELTGLDSEDCRTLLGTVSAAPVPDEVAATAHQRTEGNPFFLVEYARLARDEERSLTDVLAGTPQSVADVLRRRIRQLPDDSAALLTAAAVVGREFDVESAAAAAGRTEAEALDLLEPVLASELVRDLGGERFRFGHALVRETAYAALSPSRRQRLHALLAERLEGLPGVDRRAGEIARHWAEAGPRRTDRAWRAAARAGALAMEDHAAEQALAHYDAALALAEQDPEATERERFDLLLGRAQACRWSGRLVELVEATDRAVLIGHRLQDPELVDRATAALLSGAIWPPRPYGTVEEKIVGAVRDALDALPAGDSGLRCRLMLALAGELYYRPSFAEQQALADEAVAMARRLGEDRLLLDACLTGYVMTWRRGNVSQRLALAEEALGLAITLGDDRAAIVARLLRAVARCAVGETHGLRAELGELEAEASSRRLYFDEVVILSLLFSLAMFEDDRDTLARLDQRLRELDELVSAPHKRDTIDGTILGATVWGVTEMPPMEVIEAYVAAARIPVTDALMVLMLRNDRREDAARIRAAHPTQVRHDHWYAEMSWAFASEIALAFADSDLGSAVYERLAPHQGGCVISGTAPAAGPVDAYLALAAAAAGDLDVARTHAEAATLQCREWRMPVVARWLDGLRDRHGF